MKEKFKIFCNILIIKFKNLSIFLLNKLKFLFNNFLFSMSMSFKKCLQGEEKLSNLLWFWCFIPIILGLTLFSKLINSLFIFQIGFLIYILLCMYLIMKTIKVHPEYNVSRMKKIQEKEYINSLSEEEIKKYKVEKLKKEAKSFTKKMFLFEAWQTDETYKTMRLFLIFAIIVVIKNIFY